MRRIIDVKHVGPKAHVHRLLEELLDRLEKRLTHFPADTVSVHVVFEENRAHQLYRTALTCHVPHHTLVAHEERRDAGSSIRETFEELERQLDKQNALRRKPAAMGFWLGWFVPILLVSCGQTGWGQERGSPAPTQQATEALQLLESTDPYQRQLGFLRLEALRELSTAPMIARYLDSRDMDMRAWSLRALSAIEGSAAIPLLLERLRTDRSPEVRRSAILGLELFQGDDPRILPALLNALHDRSTEVRITAVDVVSRVDDPRAREAIRIRNRRERRRDVRRVLGAAMQRLK